MLRPTPYLNRSMSGTPKALNFPGRAFGTFVTAGSGNTERIENGQGQVIGGFVQCNLLKNGLCVGMYDYKTFNTPSSHRRTFVDGDFGSSWVNVEMDLERPHLLGPGNHSNFSGLHMPSIDVQPGSGTMRHRPHEFPLSTNGITGTSFSAPAVLSIAIQAHQFKGWFSALAFPMVNKAILMSATRDANADGAIGKAAVWSQNAPSVDAEDGAGEINMTALKATLQNNRYFWTDLADADFASCGTNCRKFTVATLEILAGTRLRVALAWQSCMMTQGGPETLNDLDLAVNCPGNPLLPCNGVIISNTVPSELEMLERPACAFDRTCAIEIRIKNGAPLAACGSTTTERVGVAWSLNP
jgi:hypothetical protein